MHIDDFELVDLALGNQWEVKHHQLYNIDPDQADLIEGFTTDTTIWHTHFVEDLVLAVNHERGVALDIGWYPDSRSDGNYHLQLLRLTEPEAIDWDPPLRSFKTRSLDELIAEIAAIRSPASSPGDEKEWL